MKQILPGPAAGAYDVDSDLDGKHSSMPWFRLFPSDWRSSLQGLSLSQVAVYTHLTLLMLEGEAPVREDPKRLARLFYSSVPTITGAIESLLAEGKIARIESGLWSDFAEKEMRHRRKKSEKARENVGQRGKKSKQKQQPVLTDDELSRSRSRGMDDLSDRPFADISAYEPDTGKSGDARPPAASLSPYRIGQCVESPTFGRVRITEIDGDTMTGEAADSSEVTILVEPGGLQFSDNTWWEDEENEDASSL